MKHIARLVVLMLIMTIFTMPSEASGVRVYAAASTVRCYAAASRSSGHIGTLGYGESVECIEVEGDWALVQAASGAQAYCRVSELTTEDPNHGSLTAYVVSEGARAYARPGRSYRSVSVAGGTKLTVIAMTPDRDWCRVHRAGVYAYMRTDDLTTDDPDEDKPEQPRSETAPRSVSAYAACEVVYIYASPSKASGRTDTIGYGEKLTCTAVDGSWAQVTCGDTTGWCYTDRLTLTDPNTQSVTVYPDGAGVKAYPLPDASSGALCTLKAGAALKCVAVTPDGRWLRVTASGKYGYVRANDMTGSKPDDIDKLLALALEQLGKPYVYATRGPNTFDCAGFTIYCYGKIAGISLGRSAQLQGYNERFEKIDSIDKLLPGDLVCFNTVEEDSDLTDHTGIYLGDGKFIHASSAGGKVMISSLTSGFYNRTFTWARRLIY